MDVGVWLRGLGLGQYEAAFRANEIDAAVLPKLTAEDLKELGVVIVGHRRKILAAIADLSGPSAADTGVANAAPAAHPIYERTASDSAERRQLTVMFCDLVGSTALSARLDPEDMREIIGAYHRCCADRIEGNGGFVAKYMGDGVLAYFGYPQAHEHDAERAVQAGLAIVEATPKLVTSAGSPLRVRIGIATGLVVVGDLIGSGEAQERGVVGETPNLAARLQGIAEPDTVVIADSTRRLIGNLFELKDLGGYDLKGIGVARAWAALRASSAESRFEALHMTGLTALVGREEEIELLLRRWSKAKNGEGQVALVSGEAGIGKSRVTAALLERLEGESHTKLRYFCSPQHTDSALYPFIAQLERAAGFDRNDAVEARLSKLRALLTLDTPDDDISLVSELLLLPSRAADLSLSPQRKRKKLLEALLNQLETEARRRPVLMLFEDAHWMDPTSRELLDDLILDRVRRLPVLLVITFRPEFQPSWGGRAHVTSLALSRLGDREGEALVRTLAGNAALAAEIVAEIVERTDGVPLFVEELTKAVLESAAPSDRIAAVLATTSLAALSVPATLHASLMARLDRLGPSPKEIAQIGAVLGRDFAYELIEPVAQRPEKELQTALDQLGKAGLLFCRGIIPHASYRFKHALVQDAAYSTLLRGRRQELHARVAAALEAHFADLVERQPELLAHHFTQAGLNEIAITYWQRAGEQALKSSANAEAAAHLTNAIQLVQSLPAGAERNRRELGLQMALGSATRANRGHAAPETLLVYSRARDLLGDSIGVKEQIAVLYGLWSVNVVRMEYVLGRGVAQQSLSVLTGSDNPEELAFASRMMGFTLWAMGELVEARPYLERTVALYAPGSGNTTDLRYSQDHAVWALTVLGLTLWPLGYPDQAAAAVTKALSWAHDIGHAMTVGFALIFGCVLNGFRADPPREGSHSDAVAYCVNQGLKAYIPWAQFYQGLTLVRGAEYRQGLDLMRAGMAGAEEISSKMHRVSHLGHLASAHGRVGEPEVGLGLLDEAIHIAFETKERVFEAELHRLRGELLIQLGQAPEAENELHRSIAIAREQQARMWELRAAVTLARLWRDQGKRAEAHKLLAPIYGWFTEGFDTFDLKEAKTLLEDLA